MDMSKFQEKHEPGAAHHHQPWPGLRPVPPMSRAVPCPSHVPGCALSLPCPSHTSAGSRPARCVVTNQPGAACHHQPWPGLHPVPPMSRAAPCPSHVPGYALSLPSPSHASADSRPARCVVTNQAQSVYQQGAPQQQPEACVQEVKQFIECAQNQSDLKLCEGFSEALKKCRLANGQS